MYQDELVRDWQKRDYNWVEYGEMIIQWNLHFILYPVKVSIKFNPSRLGKLISRSFSSIPNRINIPFFSFTCSSSCLCTRNVCLRFLGWMKYFWGMKVTDKAEIYLIANISVWRENFTLPNISLNILHIAIEYNIELIYNS